MNDTEKLFEINSLVHIYNNQEVLRINNLVLKPYKIYGIMGPSGAGKSTLLRLLNMLEKPTKGKIFFHDREITSIPEKERLHIQRKMAMVFQTPVLFNTSVYDNVAYGLKLRNINHDEIYNRVKNALEQVGMTQLSHRNALSLSGGEKQRIAVARAMVLDIDVLLMDEPTANLDPGNISIIEDLITYLNREHGISIIMVTHNMFQAQRISDEVIFFHEGEMIEKNNVEHIFSSPQDERTAKFINGRMIH